MHCVKIKGKEGRKGKKKGRRKRNSLIIIIIIKILIYTFILKLFILLSGLFLF